MRPSRSSSLTGIFLVAATACSIPAQAQDPAPAKVLEAQGLVKGRSGWCLKDEKKVLEALKFARSRYHDWQGAMQQKQELEAAPENPRMMVAAGRQQIQEYSQQASIIDQQIESLGQPFGIAAADRQRNMLIDERNRYTAEINRINGQIQAIEGNKEQFQEQAHQVNAEINKLGEDLTKAVEELDQAVKSAEARYAELAKDAEVAKALATLGEATKSRQKPKIGPSKEMLDAIKQLKSLAMIVKRETIEPDRENGVHHVQVYINGKGPFRMVFDTGAGITTITPKIAKQIGLPAEPAGSSIELGLADGSKVMASKVTLARVKVGSVSVPNVACAVMPAEKSDSPCLLGRSFIDHVKVVMHGDRLVLTRLDDGGGDTSPAAESAKASRPTSKAGLRGRNTTRSTPKTRRPVRGRRQSGDDSTPFGDGPAFPDGDGEPPQ